MNAEVILAGVMLAALKGNAGPNAYGPDPLAKPPAKPNL